MYEYVHVHVHTHNHCTHIAKMPRYRSDLLLLSSAYRCLSALYLHKIRRLIQRLYIDTARFTNWVADCDLILESSCKHQWPSLTSFIQQREGGKRERERGRGVGKETQNKFPSIHFVHCTFSGDTSTSSAR